MTARIPRTKPTTRLVFARTLARTRSAVSSTRSIVALIAWSTRSVSAFTFAVKSYTSSRDRGNADHRRLPDLLLLDSVDQLHDLVDERYDDFLNATKPAIPHRPPRAPRGR